MQREFGPIAKTPRTNGRGQGCWPDLRALFRKHISSTIRRGHSSTEVPTSSEIASSSRRYCARRTSLPCIAGEGNGPIDAFVDALKKAFGVEFSFIDYHEHAVGRGTNATAACYVEIQDCKGRTLHGVGFDPSIVKASLKATLSAVMRLMRQEGRA